MAVTARQMSRLFHNTRPLTGIILSRQFKIRLVLRKKNMIPAAQMNALAAGSLYSLSYGLQITSGFYGESEVPSTFRRRPVQFLARALDWADGPAWTNHHPV